MKDKDTRRGTGVAFILFLDKESAQNCAMIKASIAIGNGRAAEFIKDETIQKWTLKLMSILKIHLEDVNLQRRKRKKKKKRKIPEPEEEIEEDSEDEGEDPALNSLSQATDFQQVKIEKQKPSSGGSFNIR
ncbi:hypothetical protein JEQ12_009723 [Ovis aries]|uniref:Uncharacterized protein n=1 Tax=Ovis aries TaxID=9940 RepID=A0A836D985_SHEEP|nr:hypothetical protein JEQ12_009723 [Ovis aries]